MPARLLSRLQCVSLPRRVEPPRRRRNARNRVHAIQKPSASSTSTSSTSTTSSPPRFSFAPRDAYDATRALLLSLAVTSVGSAGVGSLADWLVRALSLPLADARSLAAVAAEGTQLAAVSLVVDASSSKGAGRDFFSFDFFRHRGRAIAIGLVGGLAAVAAVAGADYLLSSFFSSPSPSAPETATAAATATSVAASVLSDASGPLSRAALLSASCVLAPVTEELVFRGILLRSLLLGRGGSGSGSGRGSSSPLLAPVAASAAAFAAAHLSVLASDGSSSETPKELLLLFVLGLVLGVTAVVSNEGVQEEEEGQERGGGGAGGQESGRSDESGERAERGESDGGGGEGAKRQESGDSFNLAAPALAHALYNAIAYCVAAAAPGG